MEFAVVLRVHTDKWRNAYINLVVVQGLQTENKLFVQLDSFLEFWFEDLFSQKVQKNTEKSPIYPRFPLLGLNHFQTQVLAWLGGKNSLELPENIEIPTPNNENRRQVKNIKNVQFKI